MALAGGKKAQQNGRRGVEWSSAARWLEWGEVGGENKANDKKGEGVKSGPPPPRAAQEALRRRAAVGQAAAVGPPLEASGWGDGAAPPVVCVCCAEGVSFQPAGGQGRALLSIGRGKRRSLFGG